MHPTTPLRPVSSTFFETVQLLHPHPRIRTIFQGDVEGRGHGEGCALPGGDEQASRSAEAVDVDQDNVPRLYASRRQFAVASSRVLGSLGRLDTHVPAARERESAGGPSGLSLLRVRDGWGRSSCGAATEGGKKHGTFCRTRGVVKRGIRGAARGVDGVPADVRRSGFWTTPAERLIADQGEEEGGESVVSMVSDEGPLVAPRRTVASVLCLDTQNEDSIVAMHSNVEEADDGFGNDALRVALLRLRSSKLSPASKEGSPTAETSSYYTPSANADDNVFYSPDETSQTDRPVSSFTMKLRKAMEQTSYEEDKAVSTASTAPRQGTLSPSSKLRHTALSSIPDMHTGSLRSQYSASESGSSSSALNVSKMRSRRRDETEKTLRIAPSLEEGVFSDGLEVFEENALAAAAPIVHGIEPDIVDIRRSHVDEAATRRAHTVSDHHRMEDDMTVKPLVIPDKSNLLSAGTMDATSTEQLGEMSSTTVTIPTDVALSRASERNSTAASSSPEFSVLIPTMPFPVLETIVFSAAYGDAECRKLAANLYKQVTEADTPDAESRWGAQEQHLLRQSYLVHELDSLVRLGYLRQDIFRTVRQQLFPTGATESMEGRDFMAYVHHAVSSSALDADRAKEILNLVLDDENFMQSSPEDEVFFERRPFNSAGFVYESSTDDGHYERLHSLRSTVGTSAFESVKPRRQFGYRSSQFLSKIVQIFRFGH
ncbi:hypothetical protein EJ07DRAFT_155616 [Lizonia empirigonia]|nr:hypothetical protein EJ07DRAFT_155616 [Lizonia empirigonia]